MKRLIFKTYKTYVLILILVFTITTLMLSNCNKGEELEYITQTKEVLFTHNGKYLYLLKGVDVNQLEMFEVTVQSKDVRDNSSPTEIKVSSIPNDGTGPLDEIQLGGVEKDGKFISSLPELGIKTLKHRATLKFILKFNDGEEIIRTFQVRPVSVFQYSAPSTVFEIIDNVSNISYIINSGNALVDGITIRKRINNNVVGEIDGDWGITGEIPIQGRDYNAGDSVYYQIEASNNNAIAISDWIGVAVLKPEGEYVYFFEIFFGGSPELGFIDGCWSGVHGGKSFINTIFNYEGASGGTGAFNDNGWNTSLTHIVGNTTVIAYSDLVAANYSSDATLGTTQDLLTPQFNASATKNNKLEFYYYCQASGDKVNHLKIFVTTDNTNWIEVADLSEQPAWSKQVFDLTSNVIRVKFRGISGGASNAKYNTYIDDIKIFGEF